MRAWRGRQVGYAETCRRQFPRLNMVRVVATILTSITYSWKEKPQRNRENRFGLPEHLWSGAGSRRQRVFRPSAFKGGGCGGGVDGYRNVFMS